MITIDNISTCFLFIYEKDGKIKALDTKAAELYHKELLSDTWKHTATINAMYFVEHLFNEVPDSELRKAINTLAQR